MQLHSIEADSLAARRRIFGEGDGYYIHMAAIAVLERSQLDWPMLEPHARAAQIEDRLLRAASYIVEVLGDRPLKLYYDYEGLVRELMAQEHQEALRERLTP
ncbi:hypothetical protein [Erythrobacter sp. HL-111]|uniref:hypothetical protein n=1 Tax=Erythrobacter sp. HL-111 TaxID=1798193 RepID=UPI0006DA5C44|nr:hypothetical protein [Erythrobacter sp. HL-111]KPP90681.1 MAG: hypothetical protein HLUCCO15_09170 [Erythrobacteraceae bacterium HL-111]SDS77263.1 hypothetical protein SAMN04515621_2202 [Erythrobacter sp. HL-111]